MSSYSRACKLIRPTQSNRPTDDDSMYTRSRHGRHGPFGGPEGPGRGFGGPARGFGGPFGGPPWGGPGGRGPGGPGGHRHGGRRRRGEVRNALLLLLAEEPRNGYQLMQEIEQRSGGRWRPSPGSVYPALAQLEDEGLVNAIQADRAARSRSPMPAAAGRAARRPGAAMAARGRGQRALAVHVAQPSRRPQPQPGRSPARATRSRSRQACELLTETRRGLYRLLAEEPEPPRRRTTVPTRAREPGPDDGLLNDPGRSELRSDDPVSSIAMTASLNNGGEPTTAITVRDLVKTFGEVPGGARGRLRGRFRRGVRLPGTQRRRQDDHDQHALHAHEADVGNGERSRATTS